MALFAAQGGGADDDADGGGEEGLEVGEAVAYVDGLEVRVGGMEEGGLVSPEHIRHFAGFVCGDVDACF